MCPTGTTPSQPTTTTTTATSGFRRAFEVIDADHDGKISSDDLKSFYSSFSGNGEEDAIIKAMISLADANKDGFVQYDEFQRVLNNNNNNKSKGQGRCYGDGGVMEEVFKVMDQDGDGRLGLDDLKSYLGRVVGVNDIGDDEIKAMIRLGGGDDGLGVSFDGFLNIFSVHDLAT